MSFFQEIREKMLPFFGGQSRPTRNQFKTTMAFNQATTDYEQYLKDLKADSLEHIKSWAYDYPQSAGGVGGGFRKPVGFGETLMAPAEEKALYNDPSPFPGISSIVNLRSQRRRR